MFSKHDQQLTDINARIESACGQVADLCVTLPVYAD